MQDEDQDAAREVAKLEHAVARELGMFTFPHPNWVLPRETAAGEEILNVLIVGGGQNGLSVAFSLMRQRVDRILVVDGAPSEYKGPWSSFARMPTLRSPKHITGPDLNYPSLTCQAWYEARHGVDAWAGIEKVSTPDWADYLVWYRRVAGIPVEDGTKVEAITWDASQSCFIVGAVKDGKARQWLARKIVLCTGLDGGGEWYTPKVITGGLSSSLYANSSDSIDFAGFAGKRVAVVGSRSSAFDNAATALEAGAAEVHMFYRRDRIPAANPFLYYEKAGWIEHFAELPDAVRWRIGQRISAEGYLIPDETYKRAARFDNFHLHPESPVESTAEVDGVARLKTPKGEFDFDFVVAATGLRNDLSKRSELSSLHPGIRLWQDQYTPPAELQDTDLAHYPYLGSGMQFLEKTAGEAPHLSGVFCFNGATFLSFALHASLLFPMRYFLPRVTRGITRSLFLDDADALVAGTESSFGPIAVYADYPMARGGGGPGVEKEQRPAERGPG